MFEKKLKYIRCKNCMTLNATGQKMCSICGYGLSSSNLVTLPPPPAPASSRESKVLETPVSNKEIKTDSSTSQEKTYLRCVKCMSLNNMDYKDCSYCGAELSSFDKVTVIFSSGTIGRLAADGSSGGPRIKESFDAAAGPPGMDNYQESRFALSWNQMAIITMMVIIGVAVSLYFLHTSGFEALKLFIISIFDLWVFIFLGMIFYAFPFGSRNRLGMIIISISIIVPMDYFLWVYALNWTYNPVI